MDISQILQQAEAGDADSKAALLEAVYQDLKILAANRMSGERPDHTLTATALVNEVSLKILNDAAAPLENRGRFFGYVSRAMRNLLIDHARTRTRQKRGGNSKSVTFEEALIASQEQPDELLELNEALDRLAKMDERKAQVVEMKYFGGLTNQEVADALDVSLNTVKRDWEVARTWLMNELS